MEGQMNGNIFRCNDGHKYYRIKSDTNRTKWYLECYKYRTGCRVVVHTNYTDKTVDRLRVLHQNGTHNHPPLREPLKCAQSLSGQNNHTRKTWETPHAEYASGGGRKSVVKK